MKYRTRFEIASNILSVALEGNASKRRLMYASFLSSSQINDYLNFLTANELIAMDKETHAYALTEKGMHFLHIYDDLNKLIPLAEALPAV
jgi:predicted transcriptional regulator